MSRFDLVIKTNLKKWYKLLNVLQSVEVLKSNSILILWFVLKVFLINNWIKYVLLKKRLNESSKIDYKSYERLTTILIPNDIIPDEGFGRSQKRSDS